MILILSRESAEITTDRIIDWLSFYNADFFRLNGEDLANGKCSITFNLKDHWSFIIKNGRIKIHSDQIRVIWYRRSFDWDISNRFSKETNDVETYSFLNKLNNYHQLEIQHTYSLIEHILKDRYWLNQPSTSKTNKLFNLEIAKNIGFQIPKSIITNNTSEINNHKDYITKPIVDGTFFKGKDFGLSTMTQQVNLNKNLIHISPSLFQEKIIKKYELRIIFIEKIIFAIAIFSQNNTKTQIDYRHYDKEKPNRQQLILLDNECQNKVNDLMNTLNLNFGSIDLIKTHSNNYVFLEVNPVGQFLGISQQLNLNIDKVIAQTLIKNHEV